MEDDPQFCETLEFETQTDILTLLENVKCQGCNPSILHQALNALATIFCTITDSQDYFRLVGGLDVLTDLLVQGHCPLIAVPGVLYCLACAVKQNVTSQNILLSNPVLKVLHCLLSESESDSKILQSASFLLACVVSGSGKGQSLAYETQCLQDLLNLLRNCVEERCNDDNKWSVFTKAIGVCVNNPQNDKYQQVCCSVLPHVLKFLCDDPEHESVRHILFLLGLVVANNASNQERIRKCGGVEILITFIKKQLYSSLAIPDHKLLASGVAALDACLAENEKACKQAEKLGIIPVILDVLDKRDLDQNDTQVVVLTLAHILESTKESCSLVSEGRGYSLLVNILTETQDEELFKTIKYILTISKTTDSSHEKNYEKPGLESRQESKHDNSNEPSNQLSSLATKKCNALLDQLDSLGNLTNLLSFLGQGERTDEHSNMDRLPTNHRDVSKLYPGKPFRQEDFNSDRALKHQSTSSKHSTGGEAQRVYHKSHALGSKFSPSNSEVSLPQNHFKATSSREDYQHQHYYKKPNLSLPNFMEQKTEDDESFLGFDRPIHNTSDSLRHLESYKKHLISSAPSFQNTGKRKESHCSREIPGLNDRHSTCSKKENYQYLNINNKHSNLSMPQSGYESRSIHTLNDDVASNKKQYLVNGKRKDTDSNKYFNLRNNFPNSNTSISHESLHSPRYRYKDTDVESCTGRGNQLSVSPSNQPSDANPGAGQCGSPVPSQHLHQTDDASNERTVNSSLLKPTTEISAGESQTNISVNPLYIVGQLHQTLSNFLTSLSLFTPKPNMNSNDKAESSAITLAHIEPAYDDISENIKSTSNASINTGLTAGNKASPSDLNLAGKDLNAVALNLSHSLQDKHNEMLTSNKFVEEDDLKTHRI
ncbi:telomere repeats-binding bouquet formation protein 1-like [Physella acuta]|uniref:telomere repeats-binding bouquet formation protein 1-like n=1 Tax=Physella acuta TaxID=109671 RepID=UPI0027DCA3D8|nr:telomere repeats-binding bouquet formation protein 1-like [Physella acuta]